jgi:hypothetical protein
MTAKSDIVRETISRLNNFPTRSIARYLLDTHGGLWDNDLEKIRHVVRYARGENGELSREINKNIIPSNKDLKIPQTWRIKQTEYKLNPGKWLILSDLHVPFHEIIPLQAALEYGAAQKCTGIFINGDAQDCQAVSFWPSTRRKDFMAEVFAFIDVLDYMRQKFPMAEIIYKPGNHEYRLPRYYASHCPDLIGSPLAAMESIIDFEGRGIEFLDYFQVVMAGKLPILHGHEFRSVSRAVNPARGLALKAKTWAACSHFHTTSEHTSTNLKGEYLTTWSFGCLCDLHPEYNPFGNDWNWGAAIITIDEKGNFEVQNKRILPGGKIA